MGIVLYHNIFSPAVRAVILTLEALAIPYELKKLDLPGREHLASEEFLKINPQHTVPTIQDEDGFVIWESHAINAYLVNRYGKDDQLYPKEPKARALIDQRLHFDSGVFYINLRKVSIEVMVKKSITKMTDELNAAIEESYKFIEKFLEGRQYIAGDSITIADFSITTTLANAICLLPLNEDKFPLMTDYLKRCELNIPGLKELNEEGMQSIRENLTKHDFELPSE